MSSKFAGTLSIDTALVKAVNFKNISLKNIFIFPEKVTRSILKKITMKIQVYFLIVLLLSFCFIFGTSAKNGEIIFK